MYFCTRAISLFVHFREATSLIRIANVARGTTTSALHPCRLLPSSILASPSRTPPFPSASSRRADLLVFFPFEPRSFGLLALYSVTATFVAPRAASPFSLAAPLPLLPPTDSPLLSLSLRLRFSSSRDSFLFSSLSLVPPRFNLFQLLLLFSPSERDAENDEEQVRGKDRGRENERNYERKEKTLHRDEEESRKREKRGALERSVSRHARYEDRIRPSDPDPRNRDLSWITLVSRLIPPFSLPPHLSLLLTLLFLALVSI